MPELTARATLKREQILDAALEAFLENGYVGASMDQVAATASVSKQTVYKQFADKEHLFRALIVAISDRVEDPFAEIGREVAEVDDVEQAVRRLADAFVSGIMTESVQQMRRLVIAEAARFPDLGEEYWNRGFGRVIPTLADCLARLAERGLLSVKDPLIAANHLAGLLLWIPSNRVMFFGRMDANTAEELAQFTEAGVEAFLAAYKAK
jgi:TetR/AcrR family transcriptional regulator, mexJK operon transcriptional repressor